MHIQDIVKLLGLQGVQIVDVTIKDSGDVKETEIQLKPINYIQDCPCCNSNEIIRNGKDGDRQIKHLKIANTQCILSVPRVRLKCKTCGATYAYSYEFVNGRQRYTEAYKAQIYELSVGSTVSHAVNITETPYSTAERFFKEAATQIAPLTTEYVQKLAHESAKLVLGIDDFAIRKGHKYNTGIHDLSGESMLGVAEGRTVAELHEYMEKNPLIAALKPYAIVMDLARNYHAFAAEYFPDAIRVADRFHVNSYIIEALNEIRRRVSKELEAHARVNLKKNKHLLNKRNDSLNEIQCKKLEEILSYSDDLKAAYELKEELIDWYDLSFNHESASIGYNRWLTKGHSLNIPEIENALKTFENWRTEIINYHRCRFTNGIVEGRNGKIKSLQRRRFFLRNRTFYEALIIIGCNMEIAREQFKRLRA